MTLRALLHFARAETRRSRGTLLFCVFSIAIGVASVTAVRAILASLEASIALQARAIAGADLTLSSRDRLDGETGRRLTRDLESAGAKSGEVISFLSMLYRDRGEKEERSTRLVRVRAISGGYPFYGTIETDPPGRFDELDQAPALVVDPIVLRDLDLEAGDAVRLGEQQFEVAAAYVEKPGSPAAGFSFAPVVYVHARYLDQTGLLATGSRVSYARMFRAPQGFDAEAWKVEHWDAALEANISIRTSRESAANVQRFLHRLSYFLSVVGLVTLLLGALGIGSAMNVFVRGKLDSAATFRCLGARPRDVLAIYGTVALLFGVAGSLAGVALGSLLPFALGGFADRLGAGLLPAHLDLGFSWLACVHGLAAGVTATIVFAALPILRIARVAPLRVLRGAAASLPLPRRKRDLLMYAALFAALFSFVLILAAAETASIRVALYFTGAVTVAVVLLALIARLAAAGARRLAPLLSSYHLKQGIANLHRPGNQTRSVITAVGVGVLLLSTVLIVEASLQATISIEDREDLPNLFIIDIQPQQRDEVERIAERGGAQELEIAPMVAARIGSVNGASVDRSRVERDASRRSWQDRMRTREYFLSYRDHTVEGEEVIAGAFWDGRPPEQEASIDDGLAEELGIEIGDTLTLDVQGIPVDTRVTSFRRIRWQAMRPNAMILLSPGPIEEAPKMFVASLRVAGEDARYEVQEELVRSFPNLSVIDITETAKTVRYLLERISAILGFLALLTVACGAIILGGAIAAGRFARRRESMLLRVLGASRRDLRRILISEYAALALLGGVSGWLIAEAACRPALALFFDAPARVPYGGIAAVLAGVVVLDIAVGLLVGRGVASGRPLDVLREE